MRDVPDAVVALLGQRPTATMAELADAAGVSRATLHRRFPSRESLLARIAEDAAAAAEHAVAQARPQEGPAPEACVRLVAALVPLGGRFAFLLREGAWLDDLPGVAARIETLAEATAAVIRRGRHAGQFRLDLPASFQTRLVLAAVYTAWEAVQAGELGAKEAPEAAALALLAGIEART
ncbi:helix-turn-helix domain-containing protein [Actinoplanes sp. NPDC049118]|uniref:TetR/AcrR family transcriptional regulator n=1 Tax=Actinoplanes sp. NPDC049118 TaxID=3155769 RepID=UPI0033F3DAF2